MRQPLEDGFNPAFRMTKIMEGVSWPPCGSPVQNYHFLSSCGVGVGGNTHYLERHTCVSPAVTHFGQDRPGAQWACAQRGRQLSSPSRYIPF